MTRRRNRTSGEAMIVVVCVLCVLLTLSFSLLLSSGALMFRSSKTLPKAQCRVWAVSLSRLLDKQFTGDEYTFDTQEQEDDAGTEHPDALWFYLREHLGEKKDWPYYGAGEHGHSASAAFRTFTIQQDSLPEEVRQDIGAMQIVLYWQPGDGAEPGRGAVLTAEVTCTSGGQSCTITSRYLLAVSPDGPDAGASYSQWVWSLDTRE